MIVVAIAVSLVLIGLQYLDLFLYTTVRCATFMEEEKPRFWWIPGSGIYLWWTHRKKGAQR